MYTPPAVDVLPVLNTRTVDAVFLRSVAASMRPPPIFLDGLNRWTITCPGPTAPAYQMSNETFVIICAGGTPSPMGEGWTNAAGASYRLVAGQDIAGARAGIAVMVGPSTPPVL